MNTALTIDARCDCSRCVERTEETYTMAGSCSNCGAGPFLITYRAGDSVADQDCPTCGNYYSVRGGSQRLVDHRTGTQVAEQAVHA